MRDIIMTHSTSTDVRSEVLKAVVQILLNVTKQIYSA